MRCRVAFAAAWACAVPASAAEFKRAAPAEAQVLSGAYELSSETGARKCILLLRPSDAPGGYAVGFPAQCRMALPALAKVAAWTSQIMQQAPRARIVLTDRTGEPQLDFSAEGPQGAALAKDATGQTLLLRPAQGASLAARVDSLVGARPAARVIYNPPPPDPVAMGKAVGEYRLIRPGDRDTGCRLMLEGASPAATDGAARLTQKCDDKGVAFFGPRSWTIAGTTLWLRGTRGKLGFERNSKAQWDKSPGQGEGLILIRN